MKKKEKEYPKTTVQNVFIDLVVYDERHDITVHVVQNRDGRFFKAILSLDTPQFKKIISTLGNAGRELSELLTKKIATADTMPVVIDTVKEIEMPLFIKDCLINTCVKKTISVEKDAKQYYVHTVESIQLKER